ncbi:hypothetical protein [Sphingomonas sp. 1P08PE]|uniref:hypothetical protein n=1 Tax=Sphingomonas sp. 1P08PE TaxID=554122 RepID=UPI0039A03D76
MIRSKPPLVLRLAATLMLSAVLIGQYWQRRPLGAAGAGMLTAIAQSCPAAAPLTHEPTVADTARALDRVGYAAIAAIVFRDGRDRCHEDLRRGAARAGRRAGR